MQTQMNESGGCAHVLIATPSHAAVKAQLLLAMKTNPRFAVLNQQGPALLYAASRQRMNG
jgi:hypothetical protein